MPFSLHLTLWRGEPWAFVLSPRGDGLVLKRRNFISSAILEDRVFWIQHVVICVEHVYFQFLVWQTHKRYDCLYHMIHVLCLSLQLDNISTGFVKPDGSEENKPNITVLVQNRTVKKYIIFLHCFGKEIFRLTSPFARQMCWLDCLRRGWNPLLGIAPGFLPKQVMFWC